MIAPLPLGFDILCIQAVAATKPPYSPLREADEYPAQALPASQEIGSS
jgi:hypothetical protein